ncbi:single-stranded DNA-binding protein [Ereboglobus luteus]|uniref:Single-stranded DNA-binding protein n=1 Tax=Ereboglobus luteus TaxID=1796921 RepID=A0A2U8E0Z1_9BACT|nr:single-stranded DNA-binding protein [Ereboglobus luteus]AWI08364.1 single-stranded DNA-binding protein [Ereboglobus luteus]
MASFNQVILIGNLTRDPELRVTPRGTSICQFGIAVNRTYKDESGNSKEEVNFFDIEAWGKQGEVISKFMSKGRPIFVQGRLKQDSWEDKATGQKRSKVKIVLEGFQFIGSRDGGQQGGGSSEENFDQASPVERNSPPPRPPMRNNPPPAQDNIDEDVPF